MHKQQAQETMRVIEKNMTAEKKLKLEFLLNEIVDTYFALEIGKDTYEPYVRLCLDYWTTYFDLENVSVIFDPDLQLENSNFSLNNIITISEKIKNPVTNFDLATRFFMLCAHECAHLDDYNNKRSFYYDSVTYKKNCIYPLSTLLLSYQKANLEKRLLDYRRTKFPNSPKMDEEISNCAYAIYLNNSIEKYAREIDLKAADIFENKISNKYNLLKMQFPTKNKFLQQKVVCTKAYIKKKINERKNNDNFIAHYINNKSQPFFVLYNELLQILPQQVCNIKELLNKDMPNNNQINQHMVFCWEVINLQALETCYNQKIIDQIKPIIMSMKSEYSALLQAMILSIDKKTTKSNLDNYLAKLAQKETLMGEEKQAKEQILAYNFSNQYIATKFQQLRNQYLQK